MCNNEAGPATHQIIHRLLNPDFRTGIYGTGCLIKDQNLRIRQNCPGNSQKLLLSLGHIACLFVQFHSIASRQRLYKTVYMGSLGSLDHLFMGSVQLAIADIVFNAPLKQPGILQYHAEHLAQLAAVKVTDIMAVYLDGAAVDVIEPHQQLDHGGLAGSGRTDDGNLLPRLYLGAKIIDNDMIRIISEMHMVKFHTPFQAFQSHCIRHRLVFFRLFQELEHALGSCCRGLKHVGHLRYLLDRLGKTSYVLDK